MERADEGACDRRATKQSAAAGGPPREARDERERGAHRFGPVEVAIASAGTVIDRTSPYLAGLHATPSHLAIHQCGNNSYPHSRFSRSRRTLHGRGSGIAGSAHSRSTAKAV